MGLVLANAVYLRQKVREALDRNDMPAVCELNRAADAAYLALDPFEAVKYSAWAFADDRPPKLRSL